MANTELLSINDALMANPPPWRTISQRPNKASRSHVSATYPNACDQCHRRKLGCSRAKPTCDRCYHSGRQCTYSLNRPAGRPRRSRSDWTPDSAASFPIPNRRGETHKGKAEKDVYFIFNQLSTPTSKRILIPWVVGGSREEVNSNSALVDTGSDASLAINPPNPISPIQNPSAILTSSPIIYGSCNTKPSGFAGPALCSKPREPSVRYSSANDGRAPTLLMHERGTSLDRNQEASRPPLISADGFYAGGFRHFPQPDTAFDNAMSCYHTGVPNHPTTSQLEAEMMDFKGNEHYTMEPDPFDTSSVAASSSHGGCFCLADLVESFEAKENLRQTRAGSFEMLRMLNEASERLLHCEENHSGVLYYSMLLALYEEAEGSLGPALGQKLGGDAHFPTPVPGTAAYGAAALPSPMSSSSDTDASSSSFHPGILLKAFTSLSTVVAALPFKPGSTLDKAHQDVVIAYGQKLRDKFGSRLMEIRSTNMS